jgi:8-oxo-dGTP pyrophosphatase MutT (NUDIX family)
MNRRARDTRPVIGFDQPLRAVLTDNLKRQPRRRCPRGDRRHAAVAIVLVESELEGAALLLCRRPVTMRRHAGQWALPGGRLDPGETPLDAALRELHEELGLRLDEHSVVGWLDDFGTRSGFVMTPVVLWGGADPPLTPDPDEVLAVHPIGLQSLLDCTPRFITIPESDQAVLQLPLAGDLIHAPTGAIVYQFRELGLRGRVGTRVDRIGEPVFAWR